MVLTAKGRLEIVGKMLQLKLSKRKIQKASDTIILHAWSDKGFMVGASLISKSGSKTGDYHDSMNSENFEKWFRE